MDNPYHSNTTVSYSNQDTRFFRAVLLHYKKYQGRDMPLRYVLWTYGKSWVVIGILLLLPLLFLIRFAQDSVYLSMGLVPFIVGLYVGRVLGDASHSRVTIRLWPIVRDVLDWDHVDRKLEELGP